MIMRCKYYRSLCFHDLTSTGILLLSRHLSFPMPNGHLLLVPVNFLVLLLMFFALHDYNYSFLFYCLFVLKSTLTDIYRSMTITYSLTCILHAPLSMTSVITSKRCGKFIMVARAGFSKILTDRFR